MIAPVETAIGPPSPTARRLVDASLSTSTRRAYAGALGQLDAWLAGAPFELASFVFGGFSPQIACRWQSHRRASPGQRGASTALVFQQQCIQRWR